MEAIIGQILKAKANLAAQVQEMRIPKRAEIAITCREAFAEHLQLQEQGQVMEIIFAQI